jgi:hypothetical protein
MNKIEDKIYNHYSKFLNKDIFRKINNLNSNLYGMGTEDKDFNWSSFARDVSEKISELPEMYYNNFADYWSDNIEDVENDIPEDWYEIKLEDIKRVLLGTELANTI